MIKNIKSIVNRCNLSVNDIKYIIKTEKVKNKKDLFYTLENMLYNNQIKVGG